jgi:hypothetical protein
LDEEHNLADGFFLVTLFLAVEEKVTGSKGIGSKTRKDAGARQGIRLLACEAQSASSYFVCKAL